MWVLFPSFFSCAFCEQEGWSGSFPPVLLRPRITFFQGVAWLGSQLRTSNDHCFIVGVP